MIDKEAIKKKIVNYDRIVNDSWYVYPNSSKGGWNVRFRTDLDPTQFPSIDVQRFLADAPMIARELLHEVERLEGELGKFYVCDECDKGTTVYHKEGE